MTQGFDPRTTPWRADLAAETLRGVRAAERYVMGELRSVTASVAPLHAAPDVRSGRVTEALFGEAITVYEDKDGWAWGQLAGDRYVGHLRASCLGAPAPAPTHRVRSLRTFRYAAPDIKAPALGWASLNSCVAVHGNEGRFALLADGSCIFAGDLAPIGQAEPDFVSVAERFIATPYLWGGRTSLGIDCSALLQQSLTAADIACPRDSDMIEATIGEPLPPDTIESGAAHRGDLVFWQGHCAIMTSAGDMVHANIHHMATAKEEAKPAIKRIADQWGPVTSIRRIA